MNLYGAPKLLTSILLQKKPKKHISNWKKNIDTRYMTKLRELLSSATEFNFMSEYY